MSDNQSIYDMLRDVHTSQLSTASALGRIEQSITEIKDDAKEVKAKVDKHERAYVVGKFLGVPLIAGFNIGIKGILAKLGWH